MTYDSPFLADCDKSYVKNLCFMECSTVIYTKWGYVCVSNTWCKAKQISPIHYFYSEFLYLYHHIDLHSKQIPYHEVLFVENKEVEYLWGTAALSIKTNLNWVILTAVQDATTILNEHIAHTARGRHVHYGTM
jgi:hypothetical protein